MEEENKQNSQAKVENRLAQFEETFDVTLSNEQLNRSWNSELESRRKKLKMPGFRSGKVPMEHVKSAYGEECFKVALMDNLLRKIDESKQAKEWGRIILKKINSGVTPELVTNTTGESTINVTCQPAYHVFPKVDVKEMSLPKCELIESNDLVERTIDKLVGQFKQHNKAPEGAEIKMGDLVNVTSECTIDGKPHAPATLTSSNIEVGEIEMFGAAKNLIGMKVGETKEFDADIDLNSTEVVLCDTPDEVKNIKKAHFKVTVNHILQSEEVELNDEFVKRLDPKANLETFKKEVETNVNREIKRRIYLYNMSRLLEKLKDWVEVDFDNDNMQNEYTDHFMGLWLKGDMKNKYKTFEKFVESFHNDNYYNWFVQNRIMSVIFKFLNKEMGVEVSDKDVSNFVKEISETYDEPDVYVKSVMENPTMIEDVKRVVGFRKLLDELTKKNKDTKYMTVTSLYNFFRREEAGVLEYYRIY